MSKNMYYYETFKPYGNNWQKNAKGTYTRNEQSCNAEIVYANNGSDFYIIKKNNAPWDKNSNGGNVSPSYSVCWNIDKGSYAMGLSNEDDDRKLLDALLAKI